MAFLFSTPSSNMVGSREMPACSLPGVSAAHSPRINFCSFSYSPWLWSFAIVITENKFDILHCFIFYVSCELEIPYVISFLCQELAL